MLRELELESQAGYGYLNLSHRASHRRYGVTGHTVTDSNSNIESESVSQYAQAAQRLRGDDSGGRGLPRRQQPARGAAAPGGGARRPGFGAGCLGLKIQKIEGKCRDFCYVLLSKDSLCLLSFAVCTYDIIRALIMLQNLQSQTLCSFCCAETKISS